jgi:succinate dehydrogenase/fumarate reductase iron-sulfur protein
MDESTKAIVVKVYRTDPGERSKSRYDTYTVPFERGQSILGIIKYIYENLDSSLAFYHSCRIGKCTGCHVKVNGKTRLACTTIVDGGELVLEPLSGYPIVRDLVVDKTKATISKRRDKGLIVED